MSFFFFFFFSSRRRHTRFDCDWSSDVCSSDLLCKLGDGKPALRAQHRVGEDLTRMRRIVHTSHRIPPSVVIPVVDEDRVLAFERKREAKILVHSHISPCVTQVATAARRSMKRTFGSAARERLRKM